MTAQDDVSTSSSQLFQTHWKELQEIKSDLDSLKIELANVQERYDHRSGDYMAKLEQLYTLAEQIHREQDEKVLFNATSAWLDIKAKLALTAVPPKQRLLLNVGDEYFETTVETLMKNSQGKTTYFTVLFSKQ